MDKTLEPSPHPATSERPQPPSEKKAAASSLPAGLRAGIWSLVLGMGVPVVLQIIYPVGTYFAFGAELPSYSFAARTIFLAPVGTSWLAAVVCGMTCLRLARRSGADGQRTTSWTFGVLGLCVAGLEGLMVLVSFLYS